MIEVFIFYLETGLFKPIIQSEEGERVLNYTLVYLLFCARLPDLVQKGHTQNQTHTHTHTRSGLRDI